MKKIKNLLLVFLLLFSFTSFFCVENIKAAETITATVKSVDNYYSGISPTNAVHKITFTVGGKDVESYCVDYGYDVPPDPSSGGETVEYSCTLDPNIRQESLAAKIKDIDILAYLINKEYSGPCDRYIIQRVMWGYSVPRDLDGTFNSKCPTYNNVEDEAKKLYNEAETAVGGNTALYTSYVNGLKNTASTMTFKRSGNNYVATVTIKSADSKPNVFTAYEITCSTTVGNCNINGKTLTVTVPVSSITANTTVKATLKQNFSYSTAMKCTASGYQNIAVPYTYTKNDSHEIKGTISLSKLTIKKVDEDDEDNNKIIDGGTFKLYQKSGSEYKVVGNEWTGGTKTFENLTAGTYCVEEINAPTGYVKNDQCIPVELEDFEEKTFEIKNKKTSVSISKVDATGKNELPGATLQILDKKQNKIDLAHPDYKNVESEIKLIENEGLSWVSTNTKNIIDGLPAGTYYLVETISPDGYALSSETIEFVIKENGDVDYDNADSDSVIIMKNEYTEVVISKQDASNKKELPGATLKILDKDKKEIDFTLDKYKNVKSTIELIENGGLSWVSTNVSNVIKGLPNGIYYLVEITSPDGYTKNTEQIQFEITSDGVRKAVTMYNSPIVKVENTKSNSIIYIVIGSVVLLSGIIGYIIYRKKQK